NDACDGNLNSIDEALTNLKISAANAGYLESHQPEFVLIADWANETVATYLHPENWRISAAVGTAYGVQGSNGERYVWTDTYPNCIPGDFNGDGILDQADVSLLQNYIAAADGNPAFDADGVVNGRVVIPGYASNFSIFDTNYDGVVDASDAIVPGDMNINGVVNNADVPDFVIGLINPAAYRAQHNGESPVVRGDLNGDGKFDGRDIAIMTQRLM